MCEICNPTDVAPSFFIMAVCLHMSPGTIHTSFVFAEPPVWLHVFILLTLNLSCPSHIYRSRATALQCKLQSRGWSCGLSRGVRWGEAPHKRLSFSLLVHVVQLLCRWCTQQHSVEVTGWTPCALSLSHCNSLSGLQSYHYHSVNVPQTEHPGLADSKWHLAGYAFQYSLTNIELAGMRVEFLHVCGLVFLQLWLAYLEFLSPLVHGTCIFNQQCCLPPQNFNVSAIVCTLSIAGLGLLF